MTMQPESGKLSPSVKILLLCALTLAVAAAQPLFDAALTPWGGPLAAPVNPADHKQDLRAQFGEYREGRISARDMLKACLDKAQYAEKDAATGKSALAEYIYALRSQVYLDQGNPQAALAEAQKAAEMAPSPGRGTVALGDALRALGKNEEAAGAYRQALRNPGYVPEYTAEDPMSSQTLDALFDSDIQIAGEKRYKGLYVRGKLVRISFDNFGAPYFELEGIRPRLGVSCYPPEDDEVFYKRIETDNRTPGFGIPIAQAYGLTIIAQTKGQIITVKGRAISFGPEIAFIADCVIIKIEP